MLIHDYHFGMHKFGIIIKIHPIIQKLAQIIITDAPDDVDTLAEPCEIWYNPLKRDY